MSPKESEGPIYYNTLLKLSEQELRSRVSEGPDEAARITYAAAVGGNRIAQVTYGQMLLDGHGVERDIDAAFRWFGIAAMANDADGINMLGRCFELGWGTPVDRSRAADCYRRAAAKDHHWAQYNLAMLMLRDDPGPGEAVTALTLLVRSARQGNAKAMNIIGRYRECGWAGAVNIPSAIRWYRRAAEGGCFRGAAHLARFLLLRGQQDDAVHWYRRSAAEAPVEFCRDLAAQLLEMDNPAVQGAGREALRRAAEIGHAGDRFAYGCALVQGRGGPVNRAEAGLWLHRAQAEGIPGALAYLDRGALAP